MPHTAFPYLLEQLFCALCKCGQAVLVAIFVAENKARMSEKGYPGATVLQGTVATQKHNKHGAGNVT